MSNRRHHIHVICAASNQSLVLDGVAIFFQARAFLTYDVSSELPRAALYGRQCIDDCDYTIIMIGDSYGATHNTGVSQMHLSYLSAKAKLKPMLIFIKSHQENAVLSPQLKDFIRLVERQNIGIHYYVNTADIDRRLVHAYEDMIERHPAASWVRESNAARPSALQSYNMPVSASIPAAIKRDNRQPEANEGIDRLTKALDLNDTFEFQYSAQAYEGGNLTDVTRTLSCTWQQILCALMKIPSTFSSYGLQNCMNRLIAVEAEYDIKQQMPNVHAVARCQVSQNDLLKLQHALVAANWIQLTAVSSRSSQELWKLTFYAKKIYQESQP